MGVGLRVAGRVVGQRLAASHQNPAHVAQPPRTMDAAAQGRQAAVAARNVGRATQMGAGGFFRSFRRAGSIVWLQVTGCFFFLPVLVFAPTLWKTHASWQQGPDQHTFWASTIVVVVFSYLGLTSFLRAGRK